MRDVYIFNAAVLLVAAWVLIKRGRRGTKTDDHPVCAKCGFDLVGQPPGSRNCPECGNGLSAPTDIQWGHRKLQYKSIAAGGLLLLMAIFLLIPGDPTAYVQRIDLTSLKPNWWLIHDAKNERTDGFNRPCPNTKRLFERLKAGSLSPKEQKTVVAIALGAQVDLTRKWNPNLGDMVETIRAAGNLPASDWQQYLTNDQPVIVDMPPAVSRGNAIVFHLKGELRGGTMKPPGALVGGVWRVSMTGTVSGKQAQATYSCNGGNPFDVNVSLQPDPAIWPTLSPGPQTFSFTIAGLATLNAPNPAFFPTVKYQGTWTLLSDSPPVAGVRGK